MFFFFLVEVTVYLQNYKTKSRIHFLKYNVIFYLQNTAEWWATFQILRSYFSPRCYFFCDLASCSKECKMTRCNRNSETCSERSSDHQLSSPNAWTLQCDATVTNTPNRRTWNEIMEQYGGPRLPRPIYVFQIVVLHSSSLYEGMQMKCENQCSHLGLG